MITFFFHPNITTPGGVQSLIINISRALFKKNIKIKLIDTKDGIIYRELKSNNVKFEFLDYDDDKTRDSVDENDILVSFGEFQRDYAYFRNKNIRYVYWSVFHDALITKFNLRVSIKYKKYSNNNFISRFFTSKLVKLLSNKKAIIVMEEAHFDLYKRYNSKFKNINYSTVLIPIDIKEKIDRDVISEDEINIAYIGREESWKILPFIHLLEELINLDLPKKNIIHLFSDNCSVYFDFIKSYEIHLPNNICIETYNNYNATSIKKILSSNVDILFAMGTSLLEGASIGIPTVILDAFDKKINFEYKYRWLHDEGGYSLGLPIWIWPNKRGTPLISILDQIYKNNEFKEISNKSYLYTKKYHDLDKIVDDFFTSIHQTELKLKDLYWVYRVLTIKYSTQKNIKKIFT